MTFHVLKIILVQFSLACQHQFFLISVGSEIEINLSIPGIFDSKYVENIKALLFLCYEMSKSVIIIDDDEDTVRLFSEFLEEKEINVIGNGFDGITAVKLFKETKPDVTN